MRLDLYLYENGFCLSRTEAKNFIQQGAVKVNEESVTKPAFDVSGNENIELDKPKDKFGISGSWKYKYAIFDMIEVYKYFDWDNYTMVVYGG